MSWALTYILLLVGTAGSLVGTSCSSPGSWGITSCGFSSCCPYGVVSTSSMLSFAHFWMSGRRIIVLAFTIFLVCPLYSIYCPVDLQMPTKSPWSHLAVPNRGSLLFTLYRHFSPNSTRRPEKGLPRSLWYAVRPSEPLTLRVSMSAA